MDERMDESMNEIELMEEEASTDVMPDVDDLSGIRQELESIWTQLEKLKAPPRFVGTEPGQSGDEMPDAEGLGYEAKLHRARESGDMVAALRIKQEAARAGVVLF